VLILFVEWRYLRTGDVLFRTLARWTKVMVALFDAGVVTGTILSFEMGLLWPDFTATSGSVFGLGFAIEGFSFFLEGVPLPGGGRERTGGVETRVSPSSSDGVSRGCVRPRCA
jgi:cytochrome bd-type quinol oxidase subunit 1